MKRIISLVLCFCMCLSLMSGFGFTFAADPTLSGTAYQDLFDADSVVYADTMIVFPGKTFTAGEKLTFSFSGVTVEETYNAARHFSSYANALVAWETKYTGTQLVTKVPNFVLTAGTYNEIITVRYNANIYGAQAGITPNDPDFDVKKALPTTDWAANTARPGNVGETVLAGGILRSNVGPDSEKSKYYDIRVSAGVNTQTLNIDGVKLTATSAITIADYKQSAKDATSTINVKSSIFDGNAHGFDGAQDGANQSENFNDYNVTDCRVLNQTGDFIYRYQRKVVIDDTAFSNINALYTGGNVGKTNAAKYEFGAGSNYLYWNSLGGERGVSYEIKNSRIANSTAYEFLKISDHTYYPSVSAKFDSNIFYNVGTSQWGMVMFYVYKQDGKLYPTPEISFTNNVIYSSTQKSNLLSSGTEYVDGPVNVTVTGNRIIGYDTATFNINTDTMASVMAGSVLNFDNNYYCKTANFTGTSDYNGVPFDTYNADWIRTNWNKFITVGNVPYYFDYAMTLSSADLQITGASFDKEEGYYVSQGDKTISAIIPENATWSDISFTTNAPSGSTVKLYSDTAHTQEVSSVSFNDANATGSKTYYAVLNYKGIKVVYNVVIVAAQEAIDFKTEWTEDAVKKTAALLTKEASANGAVVRAFWQGQFYSFTYGVNAFATVAEAKAKGITQMILPAGEYGAIDIPGSIELYGEDYKVNPNKKYAEPETPWTLAEAWKDVNTVVSGVIKVTSAATPTSAEGTNIYIAGIVMKNYFHDKSRSVSTYPTKVTLENIYTNPTTSIGYTFYLDGPNALSTSTSGDNKDEFTYKNSRYNYTWCRFQFWAASPRTCHPPLLWNG